MNLGDFRELVSSILSLDNTGGSAEQRLIDRSVQSGVLDLLRKTRCHIIPSFLTLDDGIWEYNFPNAILEVVQMTVSAGMTESSSPPLQRKTSWDLETMRQRGEGSGFPKYFAVEGSDLLLLYPTPSDGQDLHMLFVPRPNPLTAATDDPSIYDFGGIPEDYHDAITLFALWRCADYDDDQSSQSGDRYRQLYQGRYREIRREIKRMGTSKLAPFVIPNTRP